MKKVIPGLIITFFSLIALSQNDVKFDAIEYRDYTQGLSSISVSLVSIPTSTDIVITDREYVDDMLKGFRYWNELFDSSFKHTLIIYKNAKELNKPDSVLMVKNLKDEYYFIKNGVGWKIQNFTIQSANTTLNHVAVGLTSKQVFKLLKKKVNKNIKDDKVWVVGTGGTNFIFTFSNDKLISIQL